MGLAVIPLLWLVSRVFFGQETLPPGTAYVTLGVVYRTGWDARAHDQEAFLNADEAGPHTPGIEVECSRWLVDETPIVGVGVETVGTDAGAAHSFDPAFPCHYHMLGAGKYGLTQLANLAELPPTGAVVLAAPLKIVGGSGSPCRALAFAPRG